ncbi:MAG: class I SAM-dependent methyltransferase [Candidatus Sumerlaeia bacterium]
MFPDRTPDAATLNAYYENYSRLGRNRPVHSAVPWQKRSAMSVLERLVAEKPDARVLDVGCHDGGLLQALPDSLQKYGIDVSEDACRRAVEKGIRARCGSLFDLDFSEKFDLIVALDVMEHFAQPPAAVRRMAAWMQEDACLFIQTGNAASRPARMLGRDWYYPAIFGHLVVLGDRAMDEMSRKAGLKTEAFANVQHHDSPFKKRLYGGGLAWGFHLFRAALRPLDPLGYKLPLLSKIYCHYPFQAPMADHMIWLGRKK